MILSQPTKGRNIASIERHSANAVEKRLQEQLARNALGQYGMADARLGLIGFHHKERKLVFKVTASGEEEYLLKMYPPPRSKGKAERYSEAALRSQLLWQSALRREAGLSVPEPVATSEGSLTSRASAKGAKSRVCALARWVPGEQKAPAKLTPEDLRLIGSHTARLHRHAEGYSAPEGFLRPLWDWNRTFGRSAQIWERGREFYSASEMAIFSDAAEFARRDLRALGTGRDVFGLVHHDIQAKNLVFDGERVSAIDFESCGWGYYLFDVALISLRLERQGDRHAGLHDALLEGYRQARPLSERHQGYLETFAVMRIVGRLNGILRLEDPASYRQGQLHLPGSVKRLEEFVGSKREEEKGPKKFIPSRARHILGRLKSELSSRRAAL